MISKFSEWNLISEIYIAGYLCIVYSTAAAKSKLS